MTLDPKEQKVDLFALIDSYNRTNQIVRKIAGVFPRSETPGQFQRMLEYGDCKHA